MLHRKRGESRPEGDETSLIAHGTLIVGDLRFSGLLHLDGRIDGAVSAQDERAVLTVSERGHVQGEVRVPHAIINGCVHGDIHASNRLELAAHARVHGDVYYRTLEMAAGAQVNGRMSHQPADAPPRELPAPAAAETASG
jgi:cytoskeletal protein CcmA (bactofilin family)